MSSPRKTGWFLAAGFGVTIGLGSLLLALLFILRSSRVQVAAESSAPLGWVRLGHEVEAHGVVPAAWQSDGATEPAVIGGSECHALKQFKKSPELYAYFRIDPAIKERITNAVQIEVTYFDADKNGHFRLDYDSRDETVSNQAYTQSKEYVRMKDTQQWRTARFVLDNLRLEGRQNDRADFRVVAANRQFFLRSVSVIQEPAAAK